MLITQVEALQVHDIQQHLLSLTTGGALGSQVKLPAGRRASLLVLAFAASLWPCLCTLGCRCWSSNSNIFLIISSSWRLDCRGLDWWLGWSWRLVWYLGWMCRKAWVKVSWGCPLPLVLLLFHMPIPKELLHLVNHVYLGKAEVVFKAFFRSSFRPRRFCHDICFALIRHNRCLFFLHACILLHELFGEKRGEWAFVLSDSWLHLSWRLLWREAWRVAK